MISIISTKSLRKTFTLVCLFFIVGTGWAQTTTSTGTGKWHDAASWDNGVPSAGYDVVIQTGHVITYNALNPSGDNNETVGSLDISGTLNFPFAATADDSDLDGAFSLTVTGTTTVNSGGTFGLDDGFATGANRTHQLFFEGAIANEGTIDLVSSSTSRRVDVDFDNNTFSVTGSGTYNFYDIEFDASTVTFSSTTISVDNAVDLNASSTLIVDGGSLEVGDDNDNSPFEYDGDGATFTVTNGAVVTIGAAQTNNGRTALFVDADNATLNLISGTLNIGNLTTSGEGGITIDVGITFDVNISGGTLNLADNFRLNDNTVILDLTMTDGVLNSGTADIGGETNVTDFDDGTASTITLSGASTVLNFGENATFNNVVPSISSGATLTIGSNVSLTGNCDLAASWTIDDATVNFDAGLDILSGNTLTIGSTGTVSIVRDETSSISDTELDLEAGSTLQIDGGTLNVGEGLVNGGTFTRDICYIQSGSSFIINDGSANFLNNAGFTDPSSFPTNNIIELNGGADADGFLTVGDGSGAASSASLNLATNLTSGTASNTSMIQINADNGLLDINSDGFVQVGAGNIGDIRIEDDNSTNDQDHHITVNGGTLDIYGSLFLRDGTGFQQTDGTTRVGFTSSGGLHDVSFDNDPDFETFFEVSGGTFTMGDGSASFQIGDNDGNGSPNPPHGTVDEYIEVRLTGGTININGRMTVSDENSRLILNNNVIINFDPQAINNLDETADCMLFQNGIIDIQGPANFNFLNPHATAPTGDMLQINGVGHGRNLLTSSYVTDTDAPVDFSQITWSFGNGSESKDGTSEGFRVIFNANHTSYGNFIINNPSGDGRHVNFRTNNRTFTTEDITITAGELDIGTNTFDDDGDGNNFSISANGILSLDDNFPGTNTAYASYTLSTGSTVNFNGSSTLNNPEVPDGTSFSNLTVDGSTVVPSTAMVVADTLTLSSGTLTAGTNVTFGTGSAPLIDVTSATRTGTIQGSNTYDIRYNGTAQSFDTGSDFEWSGSGNKDLIVNLDADEDLTASSAFSVVDLSILEGNLTDASAITHVATGDIVNNTSYTGNGTIQLSGAAEQAISSTGTATFSNLEIANTSATGVSGDLDVVISGTLALTDGNLILTSGNLSVGSGGAISGGSATSYIAFDGTSSAGGLSRTYAGLGALSYPIGTTTEYTPGSVDINSASSLGELNIIPVAQASAFTLDASNTLDLDYYWLLSEDGSFADVVADHTFIYDDSDVQGVETAYLSARYNVASPAWTSSDDTADGSDGVDDGTNTITLNDVDFITGHITAGESDEFSGTIVSFYPITDGDWDDGSNWTNVDGGSSPINRTPGTNSPVILNHTVTVDVDGQSAGSLNIDGDNNGVLIIADNASNSPSSGHSFGTVTGNGILQLNSPDSDSPEFPDENGADWSNFLGVSGGTVVYTGDGSYTLPSDVNEYNNLEITSSSTSTTKTLPDLDLTINGGLDITGGNTNNVIISDATNGDLTIAGDINVASGNTLQFQGTTARTVSCDNVIVSGTLDVVSSGSAEHALSLSGSMTSTGTIDMNTGGSTVDVTFTGADNEVVTGAGSVDFNRIILNKGTDQSSELEIDATTFTVTSTGSVGGVPSLELQNGTLRLSSGSNITWSTGGSVDIASTAKLHLNTSLNLLISTSSTTGDLNLAGSLEVSAGEVIIGDATDQTTSNSVNYSDGAEILVNGGELKVGGAIRPDVIDGTAALTFEISSGLISLARNTNTAQQGATASANFADADFSIDNSGSSFTMSGGTIEVVRPETDDGKAWTVTTNVTNYSVTGGTVRIAVNASDGFSNTSIDGGVDMAIYSNVPFYNLEIGDGNMTGDIGGANVNTAVDIDVLNDFTFNSDGGRFAFRRPNNDSDGFNVSVGGDFLITNGTIIIQTNGNGGTLEFNGSGAQTFTTNGATFGDIEVNNSGTVTMVGDLLMEGDWTYTTGTFDQNGNTITMQNSNTLATSINGNAAFDDITLSNINGITLASGSMTVSSSGTLTLSDDVIFDIGENNLIIENPTAAAITFSDVADNTNYIRCSGTTSALGITRSYPASLITGMIFPLGTNISATDYYTPAQVDMVANSAVGTVTVLPIASQHPQMEAASTALNYYWTLSGTGFSSEQVTYTFTYGTDATDIVEGGSDASFEAGYYIGNPTFAWTNPIGTLDETDNDITYTSGTTLIAADYSAGLNAAFGTPTVFYTLQSGDWDNISSGTTPWTNDACGGAQSEVLSQPSSGSPVIVCGTHTVTITTSTGLDAASLEIESGGTVASQIDDISILGDISGLGTLSFNTSSGVTPSFGSLSAGFIASSGGTVEYGGTVGYTLPTTSTYNDLIVSNTAGTTSLPNDISVNGDLTVNGSGGTLDLNGFTISDLDGDGTMTIGAGSNLEVDAEVIFPQGFNTYVLDATSTVNYTLGAGTQTMQGGITYGNLSLSRTGGDPTTKQPDGNIVVVGDLTINRRAELDLNGFDMEIQGNWTMTTQNNTNFEPGSGTVTFGGTADQTISFTNGSEGETFNNLTIDKSSGTVDFNANVTDVTVSGALVVTDGTLAMGTVPLTVTGATSTAAGGTLSASTSMDLNGDLTNVGTFVVPSTVNLAGDFSNTGTFTNTSNTMNFDNASSAQSINGNATTFNNISVSKATDVDLTINTATTINGTLALVNEGNVVLSGTTNNLIFPSSAGSVTGSGSGTSSASFSAERCIQTDGSSTASTVDKEASLDTSSDWDFFYPLGTSDGGTDLYTPVTVSATGGTLTAGSTTSIRSVNGTSTDQSISASAETINRHFDFNVTGISSAVTFDLIFQYDNADVTGSNEADYLSAYSEVSVSDGWNQPSGSLANFSAVNNQFGASATLDGTIDFGAPINTEWIAGDSDLIFPHYYSRNGGGVDCGSITCDWSDGTNWTLTDGGTTSAGSVPTADNEVTISSGHTMQMSAGTQSARNTEIEGTLDLSTTTGHSLGEIFGSGTLALSSGTFPTYDTGSGTTFFDASGGTVSYQGGAYSLPSSPSTYNNLTIEGAGDKDLSVNTTVIGTTSINDINLTNVAGPFNLELQGDLSFSSGGLNIADGTLTLANGSATTVGSAITFGSGATLELDNIGTKTLTGALSINNLSFSGSSGSLDADDGSGPYAISLTGNWDNNSASNLFTDPGTVTFGGTSAQQIDGDNTFAAVSVTNTSANLTVGTGTQTMNGLTLAASTTFDLGSNTLVSTGNDALDVDAGTFIASSGTVVYRNTADPEVQTDPITVATLEIDKSASNQFDNDPASVSFTNLVITSGEYLGAESAFAGDLTITSSGSYVTTGTTIDVDGNFVNESTLDLNGQGVTDLNVAGDFTNSGTLTPPATVTLDGSASQAIGGSSTTTFTDLVLNNSAGFISTTGMEVSGILNLNSGILDLDEDDGDRSDDPVLTLNPANAIATSGAFGSDTHIEGKLATSTTYASTDYVYQLGDGGAYRPITLNPTSASSFSTVQHVSESIPGDAEADLGGTYESFLDFRYWDVERGSGTGNVAVTVQMVNASDNISDSDLSSLALIKYNGSNWVDFDIDVNSANSPGATIGTLTGITSSFSIVTVASTDEDVNTLPVSLIEFNGSLTDSGVELTWSTASEINNDYFILERSVDGINFETISEIQGSGTTNEISEYSFTDPIEYFDLFYYRLTQVDFDGTSEELNIVVVKGSFTKDLVAYPNPTKDYIHLISNQLVQDSKYVIYNISGQVVRQGTVLQEEPSIDMQGLDFGAYSIRISTPTTNLTTRVMVVK